MKRKCPLCSIRPPAMGHHLQVAHGPRFSWVNRGWDYACPCGFTIKGCLSTIPSAIHEMNVHLTDDHILELAVEAALRNHA